MLGSACVAPRCREAIGRGYRQRLKDAFEGILQSYEELLNALRTGTEVIRNSF